MGHNEALMEDGKVKTMAVYEDEEIDEDLLHDLSNDLQNYMKSEVGFMGTNGLQSEKITMGHTKEAPQGLHGYERC